MNTLATLRQPSVQVRAGKEKLFLLRKGETLLEKTREIENEGWMIGTLDEIRKWVSKNPSVLGKYPLTIADPRAEPRVFAGGTIVMVPAFAIEKGNKAYPDGWIDRDVPMWPAEMGGQLALLAVPA